MTSSFMNPYIQLKWQSIKNPYNYKVSSSRTRQDLNFTSSSSSIQWLFFFFFFFSLSTVIKSTSRQWWWFVFFLPLNFVIEKNKIWNSITQSPCQETHGLYFQMNGSRVTYPCYLIVLKCPLKEVTLFYFTYLSSCSSTLVFMGIFSLEHELPSRRYVCRLSFETLTLPLRQ